MSLCPQIIHSLHKQSHIFERIQMSLNLHLYLFIYFLRQSRDTNLLNIETPASWIDFIQANQDKMFSLCQD